MVRIGNFFFRFRDYIFPLVLLPLLLGIRPVIAQGNWAFDARLDMAGVVVALAGQFLRALCIGFVYIRRGGKDRRIYADTLVDGGMFAHCRNPLYLGNLLIVFGLTIIHNAPLVYLIALPFFTFVYYTMVRAEEVYLSERFGSAYDDYCRRVPRFFPSFGGMSATFAGLAFDWKKLVRKEYGTTFAWLGGVLALLLWQDAANSRHFRELDHGVINTVGFALVAAYLTARVLKKKGLLGTG